MPGLLCLILVKVVLQCVRVLGQWRDFHVHVLEHGEAAEELVHRARSLNSYDENVSTELAKTADSLGSAGRWKEAAQFYQLASELLPLKPTNANMSSTRWKP